MHCLVAVCLRLHRRNRNFHLMRVGTSVLCIRIAGVEGLGFSLALPTDSLRTGLVGKPACCPLFISQICTVRLCGGSSLSLSPDAYAVAFHPREPEGIAIIVVSHFRRRETGVE